MAQGQYTETDSLSSLSLCCAAVRSSSSAEKESLFQVAVSQICSSDSPRLSLRSGPVGEVTCLAPDYENEVDRIGEKESVMCVRNNQIC